MGARSRRFHGARFSSQGVLLAQVALEVERSIPEPDVIDSMPEEIRGALLSRDRVQLAGIRERSCASWMACSMYGRTYLGNERMTFTLHAVRRLGCQATGRALGSGRRVARTGHATAVLPLAWLPPRNPSSMVKGKPPRGQRSGSLMPVGL